MEPVGRRPRTTIRSANASSARSRSSRSSRPVNTVTCEIRVNPARLGRERDVSGFAYGAPCRRRTSTSASFAEGDWWVHSVTTKEQRSCLARAWTLVGAKGLIRAPRVRRITCSSTRRSRYEGQHCAACAQNAQQRRGSSWEPRSGVAFADPGCERRASFTCDCVRSSMLQSAQTRARSQVRAQSVELSAHRERPRAHRRAVRNGR